MSSVKVSVIIPVYNVELYLSHCLESIINQTLQDIEIICIDDGSEDSSVNILEAYAAKDPRILIIRQKNFGAGRARNKGINIATGKYLAILDSDDFFDLNMLKKAYYQCERDNADICVFGSDQYDQRNKVYIETPWTIKHKYLPDKVPFSSQEIHKYIFQIFNGWPWDKLYRKDFIKNENLKFQELRTTNDAYFVFFATIQANRITLINEVFVHHRVNLQTSLSMTREKSWNCCCLAIEAIKDELINRNQYNFFEQSFINWTLNFLLWNIHTLKGTAKEELIQYLNSEFIGKLEYEKYPREYFYNQMEYEQYLNGFLYEKNIEKKKILLETIEYFFENGFISTWKKVITKIYKYK